MGELEAGREGGVWCEVRLERQAVGKQTGPYKSCYKCLFYPGSNKNPLKCFKLGKGDGVIRFAFFG